jgi:hypothetical protein
MEVGGVNLTDLCRALERYPYTDPFTPEQACSVAARAIEALQKEVEESRRSRTKPASWLRSLLHLGCRLLSAPTNTKER